MQKTIDDIIHISPDPAPARRIFNHHASKVVGSCHMGLWLYASLLEQMATARREIGFEYVRCHGLLCEALGIYQEIPLEDTESVITDLDDGKTGGGRDGKPVLRQMNFFFVDKVIDSLLDLGVRPFLELGFTPCDLASGDATVFRWKGHCSPPYDYNVWRELIVRLLQHFKQRYGLAEIRRWYYEVWNEPNLAGFWPAGMEEYFKLYKVSADAVKSVDSQLRVGGPATAGRCYSYFKEFIAFCQKEQAPVDFFSSHSYAGSSYDKTPELVYAHLEEPDFLAGRFATMRGEIEASPYAGLDLHITEFNSSVSPRSIVHDIPFNAAYLARTLSESGDHVTTSSYWTLSDIFVEGGTPPAAFHGGFGMMNTDGIRKPTYHLFRFFSQLHPEILSRGTHHILTRDPQTGLVAGILWNLQTDKPQDATLRVTIPVPFPDAVLHCQTVDREHANPYRTWDILGRQRNPDRAQIEEIRRSDRPLDAYQRVTPVEGAVTVEQTLTANATVFFTIRPVADEHAQYLTMDESKTPGHWQRF